jgi:hypothetical protein
VKDAAGEKVSDTMLKADYKNLHHNNINLLLGKAFMYNVEVKQTQKDGNTYVNTKLKSPVPMMKGMNAEPALIPAISVNFDDDDLLQPREDLGGVAKFDLLRISDLRKIVLAVDYEGSNMQKAVQERKDEKELIAKAKEIYEKIVESDRDLAEIREKFPNGPEGVEAVTKAEAVAKPVKPNKPSKPIVDLDDTDAPF